MVKNIDEMDLSRIDHVGVALWQAAAAWKQTFDAEMAARGYPWHREARGEVLAHLGPSGRSQTELVTAMGISKQAVQQLLDQLEADGVIARVADPADKRAKRVALTQLGLEAFSARNAVKRKIEDDYRTRLGPKRFAAFVAALDRLAK